MHCVDSETKCSSTPEIITFLPQTSLKMLYWTRLIYKIEEVNPPLILHFTS